MREQTTIDFYPKAPGWKAQDTSRQAAHDITAKARSIREHVLVLLDLAGPAGLTSDECAERLGLSVLSVRPRFSELYATKDIEDSGFRRLSDFGKPQIVWVVTK